MSKLIDRWFGKIGGSIYMFYLFISNLITEDYPILGSPLFLFELPNRLELFLHDYKSSVLPTILRKHSSY